MAILYADRCDRRKSQSRAHPAISVSRRDLRIKSLVVSFFRRREVKYVRLQLSGKSENVNLNSDKHDLAV